MFLYLVSHLSLFLYNGIETVKIKNTLCTCHHLCNTSYRNNHYTTVISNKIAAPKIYNLILAPKARALPALAKARSWLCIIFSIWDLLSFFLVTFMFTKHVASDQRSNRNSIVLHSGFVGSWNRNTWNIGQKYKKYYVLRIKKRAWLN